MNMKTKLALTAMIAALPLAALANNATPSQPNNGMVMCPCCQMMMPGGEQSKMMNWPQDMKAMREEMAQMNEMMRQMQNNR